MAETFQLEDLDFSGTQAVPEGGLTFSLEDLAPAPTLADLAGPPQGEEAATYPADLEVRPGIAEGGARRAVGSMLTSFSNVLDAAQRVMTPQTLEGMAARDDAPAGLQELARAGTPPPASRQPTGAGIDAPTGILELDSIIGQMDAYPGRDGAGQLAAQGEALINSLPEEQQIVPRQRLIRAIKDYGKQNPRQVAERDPTAALVSQAADPKEPAEPIRPLGFVIDPVRRQAMTQFTRAEELPQPETLAELVTAGGIEAAGAITEIGLIGAATGLHGAPLLGLHGLIAGLFNPSTGELDPESAAKGALAGAVLGFALQGADKYLPGIARPPALAGIFAGVPRVTEAGFAAAEGRPPEFGHKRELAADAIVGAILGLPGAGRIRVGRQMEAEFRAAGLSKPEAKALSKEIERGVEQLSDPANPTVVLLPDGRELPARWVLVDAAEVETSHNPHSFQPNPKGLPNTRAYHREPAEQAKVVGIGEKPDFRRIYSGTMDKGGTPVLVVENGVLQTVSGNGRAMGLARGETEALRAAAHEFVGKVGLKAQADKIDGMERPVIVRVLDDAPASRAQTMDLVEAFNQTGSLAVRLADQAVFLAERADRTLTTFTEALNASEGAATTRAVLGSPKTSREIVAAMQADGVISRGETTRYVDAKDGTLTQEGLALAEGVLLGRILRDADLIDAMPDATRDKVLRITPAVIAAEQSAPGVIAPLVEAAVRSEIGRERAGDPFEVFVRQASMTDPAPSQTNPVVAGIHRRMLEEKPTEFQAKFEAFLGELKDAPPAEMRKRIQDFARSAEEVVSGQTNLLGETPTIEGAFADLAAPREAASVKPKAKRTPDLVLEEFERPERGPLHTRAAKAFPDAPEVQATLKRIGEQLRPEGNEVYSLGSAAIKFSDKQETASGRKVPGLHLEYLESANRGSGEARRLMEVVTEAADAEGTTLSLIVAPFGTSYSRGDLTDARRLQSFYESLGFKADDATAIAMTRKAAADYRGEIPSADSLASEIAEPPSTSRLSSSGTGTQEPLRQASTETGSVSPAATTRSASPSSQRGLPSTLGTDPSSGRTLLQPTPGFQPTRELTARKLRQAAQEDAPRYDATMAEVAEASGASVWRSRAKSQASVDSKLERNPGRAADTFSDYYAAQVTIRSVAEAEAFVRGLEARGRVLESDNFLDTPRGGGKGGFRAWNLQFYEPGRGVSAEVQLIPETFKGILDLTHAQYELIRNVKRGVNLTPSEHQSISRATEQLFEFHYDLWRGKKPEPPERTPTEGGLEDVRPSMVLRSMAEGLRTGRIQTTPDVQPNLAGRIETMADRVDQIGRLTRTPRAPATLSSERPGQRDYRKQLRDEGVPESLMFPSGLKPDPKLDRGTGTLPGLEQPKAERLEGVRNQLRRLIDAANKRSGRQRGMFTKAQKAEVDRLMPEFERLRDEVAAEAEARGAEPPELAPRAEPGGQGTLFSGRPARQGEASIPFLEDQPPRPPTTDNRGSPIRREQVLQPLLANLGARLNQGRVRGGPDRMGLFRRKLEEIRVRRHSDLETTAHEIGHLLDNRFNLVRRASRTPELRKELLSLAYETAPAKVAPLEGWAEFQRLWLTQPEMAAQHAPKLLRFWEDFLERDGAAHRDAMLRAQRGMVDWFGQTALDRARSKIGTQASVNEGVDRPLKAFRQNTVDDLDGLRQMELALTGDVAPLGPYRLARLTRGKHALTEGVLKIGGITGSRADGSPILKGKSLERILEPVADKLEDFLLYAVGRRAQTLSKQGRENLFTAEEVRAMVGLETPAFRQALADYQTWNKGLLDFAQEKGIIDPAWRAKFDPLTYVPFYRESKRGGAGAKGTPPGKFQGIRRLTGGTANLRDVLRNMTDNAAMLMDAALTNEARVAAVDLASGPRGKVPKNQGGGAWVVPIPKGDERVAVFKSDLKRELEARAQEAGASPELARESVDLVLSGPGQAINFWTRGNTPRGPRVMAVLRNGKPEYYEVTDPVLWRSFQSLNRPMKSAVAKVLAVPARVGRSTITLAFDFMGANFARDTLMGWIMSKHGFKPVTDSARGMVSRITQDKAYEEFISAGGGFSSYLLDEGAFKARLDNFYAQRGIDARTVMNTPGRVLGGLESMADAFEMATRLGEFRRARNAGLTPREAAYSAREVSTDFAMRGDSATLGFFYDTVMFLKAGINGLDRTYRGFSSDTNRAEIAAKTGMVALASVGLYAMNRGNPLYDQLEDWDKDSHWHFFIPKPETMKAYLDGESDPKALYDGQGWTHIRYPRIWEIGSFARLAEESMELAISRDFGRFAGDAFHTVREQFRLGILPTAVAPVFDQLRNRIGFIDSPIETQSMQQLEPFARARAGGSRAIRKAGEATRGMPQGLQLPPARVEALLRGYFNTWASYGLTMIDAAVFDDMPDLRPDQYPVLRRFYAQEPRSQTRHLTELYDTIREATQARRTAKSMARSFRSEIAEDVAAKRETMLAPAMSKAQKKLSGLRRAMLAVEDVRTLEDARQLATGLGRGVPGLTARLHSTGAWTDLGAMKRQLRDELLEQRNTFAKQVMDRVEAMQPEGEKRGR